MVFNMSDIYQYKNVVIFGDSKCLLDNVGIIKNKNINITGILLAEGTLEIKEYLKLTSIEQIKLLDNPFVLLATTTVNLTKKLAEMIRKINVPYAHINFYTKLDFVFDFINALGFTELVYKNNHIITGGNGKIHIEFQSDSIDNCNFIFEKINIIESLGIKVDGSNAKISIGKDTSIVNAYLDVGANGEIEIGKDCMISVRFGMYQWDGHSIFDLETGERINFSKKICIGNHVWIGRDVKIYGGFCIGDNSVIGGNSVSSGKFGINQIIAGCPAKVIRENIIWARDGLVNRNYFYECDDKAGLKYLPEEYIEKIGQKKPE